MSLAVGDWVTERNTKAAIAPNPWSPSYERVRKLIKGPRKGRVVKLIEKRIGGGRTALYAEVLWNGAKSPSLHGTMRLVAIETPPAGAES